MKYRMPIEVRGFVQEFGHSKPSEPDWPSTAEKKFRHAWASAFEDTKWIDLPPEAKDGRRR